MKRAIILCVLSASAFADYSQSPQQMADKYMREIREREDRNREKFDDLERRANERQIIDELREQNYSRDVDRMIDESR